MNSIFSLLELLVNLLTLAVLFRALLSWVLPGQTNMITVFLFRVTEPILAPIRRIVPRVGMFDISPVVAIIILQIIGAFLSRY